MRNQTPITELDIEQLRNVIKTTKQEIENKKIEMRNEKVKLLNNRTLCELSNNVEEYTWLVDYKPYIFDFGYILERLKEKAPGDESKGFGTYEESLRIRIEVLEQISKMKEIPAFDTECHIESRYLGKCTSIKSFIQKSIFGQKKYRLIFHNKKADYDSLLYIKPEKFSGIQKIALLELFIFILSFTVLNAIFLALDFFVILITAIVAIVIYLVD